MNAYKTTSVAIALGAALGTSVALQADTNPFALQDLDGGYMLLAEASGGTKTGAEGKCGEGKCGSNKDAGDKKAGEGKCGEGKCGGSK